MDRAPGSGNRRGPSRPIQPPLGAAQSLAPGTANWCLPVQISTGTAGTPCVTSDPGVWHSIVSQTALLNVKVGQDICRFRRWFPGR